MGLIVALIAIIAIPGIWLLQNGAAVAFWNAIGGSGQERGLAVCPGDATCSGAGNLPAPDLPGYTALKFTVGYTDIHATVNKPIAPQTPAVSGGSGTLTFTVSPALPTGITLDSGSGMVSGIPTVMSTATQYIISVTDGTSTASSTISVTVGNPPTFTTGYSAINGKRGIAIVPQTPVVSSVSPPIFTVAPTLPSGLVLDAGTGQISGTPTTAIPATVYTVTAASGAGSATTTVSISVQGMSFTTGYADIFQKAGTTITAQTPVVANSIGTSTFTVAPALPAALVMEPATGKISGTITGKQSVTTYTVTVTDTGGGSNTATTTFTIRAN